MARISDLVAPVNPPVYRRANGDIYARLTDTIHQKVILLMVNIMGDGPFEIFDPDEEVEPIRDTTASPKTEDTP